MLSHIVPVYISSTWLDLGPERRAVEQAVQRLRETKFVGMEYFGSRDETTRRASLDDVDRSLAYICIVAGRYGSGITEAEYDRAGERGLPRFIYFKDDATIPAEWRDAEPEPRAKLDAFKKKLRANHLEAPDFTNPQDLAALVTADLHRWLFDQYLTPLLQGALRDALPHADAQTLLDAVKDVQSLRQDLRDSLRHAGFNLSVTGDDNVVVGHAEGDVFHGDKIINEAPRPIIPTLHQLRAPVGDFVGREKESAALLATLRGGGNAAITGISGMGGIGKTELAFYVAARLRDTYPDAQLVLDMRGTDNSPRDPADALASCIRAFHGLEQRLPDDLGELTRIYLSTLEGKSVLILLDNAHDGAQVRPLLPPAGSALLITSRNAVALPGMQRTTLEQLEASEARELLTGICPRVPADTADQICYLCGYLPLALRAAGSLLDVTIDLDPADYAAQLGDERTRLELLGTEGIDISVEASFNLSYTRLSPNAARVFRQLAVFPATFDAPAAEAVCEDPGHKHLTDLLRRHLVIYNPDTHRYRLHDLIRLFADSRLSEAERSEGKLRHAERYLKVLTECDELYLKDAEAVKNGIMLFDAERRNIEAGQEWTFQHSSSDEAAARLCNKYPDVGAYVLVLRLHPREYILWLEAAVAAARRLSDKGAEGRHLGNLGGVYQNLGETRRAIEFYEQSLLIIRKIGDRGSEGALLGNLGIAYRNLGELHRAIEFHEQRLVIVREIGDRRGEGQSLGNLGVAYIHLGETRRAIDFLEQDLVIAREIGDRRGESAVLGNLGRAYDDLGETQRATEFYGQALTIDREIGDRLGEGIDLFNISIALIEVGDRAQAITNAEAALDIFEMVESPHADNVRAMLTRWRIEATGGE